jgi:hypothetical protein
MRYPAVVLPAERYFADTAAKMSPCRTYTRCSGSGGLLKERKIKKRSAFYFNSELLHPIGFQLDIQLLKIRIKMIFT